ncbi:hypothetical protein SLA2020_288830 [Shorea laevis]
MRSKAGGPCQRTRTRRPWLRLRSAKEISSGRSSWRANRTNWTKDGTTKQNEGEICGSKMEPESEWILTP